jgi:hypothetical protein
MMQPRCGDMSTTAAPSLACERHSIRGSIYNRGKNFPRLADVLLHTQHTQSPRRHATNSTHVNFELRVGIGLVAFSEGAS